MVHLYLIEDGCLRRADSTNAPLRRMAAAATL